MKSDTTLKVGFIGGGINSAVGLTHKIALEMDGRFELVAGCFSRHADINQSTGERWHVPRHRIYDSWMDLLEKEAKKIDAVVVLTPTPSHTEIVIGCIEAGIAVICEKALASSAHEVSQIQAALEKHQGQLAITYNYTGYPMLRELKARIERGALGKLEQILIEMPQEGYARLNAEGQHQRPQEWRLHDGVLPTLSLDLGVHLHQLIDFLTGEKPAAVTAINSRFGAFNEVIDNIHGIAKYSNNLVCNFWYGKASLGCPNGLKIRLYGDKGSAEWFQLTPEHIVLNDNNGLRQHLDRTHPQNTVAHLARYNRFKAGHPAGFIEAFANYYTDIHDWLSHDIKQTASDNPYVFGVALAQEGLHMLEAIHQSAQESNWKKI